MADSAVAPLPAWGTFFVIVGSAAAVLTGLVFVAITLVTDTRRRRAPEAFERHMAAFVASTIVHLCTVLFVCVLFSAPRRDLALPSWLLGGCGLIGVAYALLTARRLRGPLAYYQPVREDWLWYAVGPFVVYVALAGAAVVLPRGPTPALFGVAALLLVLLFGALRNAWDVTAYIALERSPGACTRRSVTAPTGR